MKQTGDPSPDPLGSLPRELPPSPGLHARVRRTLRRRGLLGAPPWVSYAKGTMGLAAASLLIAFGFLLGRRPVTPGAGEPRFALLLYELPEPGDESAESARVAEYSAWARGLGSALELGEKLASEGVVLGGGEGREGVSPVAGMFVIRAADRETALRIARECPHLRHGGRIELRAIVPT